MRIAGSLWSVPADEQSRALATTVAAGLPVVHWDATDGRFAAPGGFTAPEAVALLAHSPAVLSEAHLMMHDPGRDLAGWAEFCSTIVVPFESARAARTVDRIAALGVTPALALSLGTPLGQVPADLPVLLMAITPGEAGSPFDDAVLARVRTLAERGRNPLIGVDGGVTTGCFPALAAAGATWLVSGTGLFTAPDPAAWLAQCRRTFDRTPARAGRHDVNQETE
ncbi:MAG: hypothetical protein QM779_09420 [Propionicimonas sp.]|uniref:hypothetical protein n=1 Tax=Propionicimonas sp. TaxID=1955623 RepID=UPI003D0FA5B7